MSVTTTSKSPVPTRESARAPSRAVVTSYPSARIFSNSLRMFS